MKDSPKLTIDEVVEKGSFGLGSLRLLLGPALGLALSAGQTMNLTLASLILQCEWRLSTVDVTLMQCIQCIGYYVGAVLSSRYTDIYGRKPIMILGIAGTLVAGITGGFSQQYWQYCTTTFFSGFFVGCGSGPQMSYICEVTPIRFRSQACCSFNAVYGLGNVIAICIGYFTLPYAAVFYWRGFLIISTIVYLPLLVLIIWSPESPRYTASKGNIIVAESVLKKMLKRNNKPSDFTLIDDSKYASDGLVTASLSSSEEDIDRGVHNVKKYGTYWQPIVLIAIMTSCGDYTLTGLSYGQPRFLSDNYCGSDTQVTTSGGTDDCTFSTRVLGDMWTGTLLDPVGPVIFSFVANCLGRKRTVYLANSLVILVSTLLYFCWTHEMLVVELMLMRGLVNVVNWLPYFIASEYFPTLIRGGTVSLISGTAELGDLASIAAAQYVYNYSPRVFIGSMQCVLLLGICMAFMLKKETNGMPLDSDTKMILM